MVQVRVTYLEQIARDVGIGIKASQWVQFKVRVTGRRVLAMVLQSVQVLIPFAADLAPVWLLFLHSNGSWVGNRCDRVNDGKRTVCVFLQLLVVMTMLKKCQYNV